MAGTRVAIGAILLQSAEYAHQSGEYGRADALIKRTISQLDQVRESDLDDAGLTAFRFIRSAARNDAAGKWEKLL
ncbi:MAG TPA: hypothetical protein VGZ02_01985 [Candidatus Baltobacteraceae bacterium]|nr:hypothetical protein [Candidatus Baltobacteraceae bacterium]